MSASLSMNASLRMVGSTALRRRCAKRHGFTLIELLVVIAIIALLATILFPVFARTRENARRASCMSNMKQLGLGFIQYTQDFDELTMMDAEPQGSNYFMWEAQLYPYIKNTQVYSCPSQAATLNGITQGLTSNFLSPIASWPSIYLRPPVSYGDNFNLFCNDGTAGGNLMSQALFDKPAETVVLAESAYTNPSQNYAETYYEDFFGLLPTGHYATLSSTESLSISFRHFNTANAVFADGHAKAMNYGTMFEIDPGAGRQVAYISISGVMKWTNTETNQYRYFQVDADATAAGCASRCAY